jgi:hypothetical protein
MVGRMTKHWIETRFNQPGCKVTVYDSAPVREKDLSPWPAQCARPSAPGSLLGLCEKHEADRQRLR